jgi:DNA-binding protein H-NS
MASYKELQAQIEVLTRQAEEARAAELQAVIEDVRAKVAEYGLTEKDIFGRRRGVAIAPQGSVVPPKYRDPKSGATWSGRGRAPGWLADKNRDKFLIKD